MPRGQPNTKKKGKAPATTTRSKGKRGSKAARPRRKSPTPAPEDEYEDVTDVTEVTGPVDSMVNQSMVGGWKVNKDLPMWLIFDTVNPVRQFKRGMPYDDDVDFPAYGPPPWDDLTESEDPIIGPMPYAPILHT